MENINYTFFDEYARFDKLCSEMYESNYGVTNYIDDMKSRVYAEYSHIYGWDNDLKQLVRLRHIRNQLAHDPGAFNENLCTAQDIEWLKSFYDKIISRNDPLALIRKQSETQPPINKTANITTKAESSHVDYTYKKEQKICRQGFMKFLHCVFVFLNIIVFTAIILLVAFKLSGGTTQQFFSLLKDFLLSFSDVSDIIV